VLTNQILLTQRVLLNQLIFADSKFLVTQLSFAESSSSILITQQVFDDTAYFFAESACFSDLLFFADTA